MRRGLALPASTAPYHTPGPEGALVPHVLSGSGLPSSERVSSALPWVLWALWAPKVMQTWAYVPALRGAGGQWPQ